MYKTTRQKVEQRRNQVRGERSSRKALKLKREFGQAKWRREVHCILQTAIETALLLLLFKFEIIGWRIMTFMEEDERIYQLFRIENDNSESNLYSYLYLANTKQNHLSFLPLSSVFVHFSCKLYSHRPRCRRSPCFCHHIKKGNSKKCQSQIHCTDKQNRDLKGISVLHT